APGCALRGEAERALELGDGAFGVVEVEEGGAERVVRLGHRGGELDRLAEGFQRAAAVLGALEKHSAVLVPARGVLRLALERGAHLGQRVRGACGGSGRGARGAGTAREERDHGGGESERRGGELE